MSLRCWTCCSMSVPASTRGETVNAEKQRLDVFRAGIGLYRKVMAELGGTLVSRASDETCVMVQTELDILLASTRRRCLGAGRGLRRQS